ncbi:hypothetical protein TRIUR3_30897 [Triticum urartu]|uniref:Uncharacterized protein n=1 Tax=Triticum urartu TaxID=4572 RepID=M7Z2Y4_TRIUA|nr:scarecrow-like protein 21 [Triticum urartu]XP_048572214.1 scarecrow-like protein 21 [Triticum urartu]XP_048572215.1 scarecrow-like protein 21 [Triticum urartu]XP_048572216.1 scarecrow-like protein 21 [Triticum urartu]EMS57478.1 hypothetical protein TRIUR3_30897 [Triticum urartu]
MSAKASNMSYRYPDNSQIPYYSSSMHVEGNGTCYVQQNHEDHHYVSSDGGSQNSDSKSQVIHPQYSTLESSSANCVYAANSSTSPQCISGSHISLHDSHSDHTYDSPASGITEVPGLGFTTLQELADALFGSDSDAVSSDRSLVIGAAMHQSNWRELLGISSGDLKQVIVACGKAVDENNCHEDLLISELQKMVSVSGEPIQRLGAYMLEGLVARRYSTGHALYKSLKCKEPQPTNSELMSYMHLLYDICPFFRFGYMSANGAIAEAVKGENFIHIIDFQIAQGSQWVTMIQALAVRVSGPPYLRITGIDDSDSAYARGGGLDIVGRRLCNIAQSCCLPFEFNAVNAASHEVTLEHLDIRKGEAIAVNFAYQLHHTPDESVCIENHRDRILRMVKSLSPRVVTLVEQEANTNTAPFFSRYMETLDYYTAMFEAIDVACPRDDKVRMSTEQHCVARDIVNLIACEGAERVERHEPFGKWRSRFAMAGFRPYPLSALVNNTIRTLLNDYNSYYKLEEKDGVIYLGWKNRKLVVSSAWQ